ncbi:MAG: pyridoxamine 5'-phosphate oxidase, partial [Proteobacteria bacterium]|nr:pyridoxamine 5'-phosphate oxidase [Burkholderiales bacterium]
LERRAPTSSESAAAYENFCVLDIGIHRIEWLYLHSQHKRRALFEIDQPAWSSHWLTP